VALIGWLTVVPLSAAEKTNPRDPQMRQIVAAFDAEAVRVPRQFRADLARARADCGTDCDLEKLAHTLAKSASQAERTLTAALQAAETQLKERAKSLKGPDGVLGAAGDWSRAVSSLDLAAERVAADMTESLSVLKGSAFGGQPLLTTLELRLASLVTITPISLRIVFTVHAAGSPTAWIYVFGHAAPGSTVTVNLTCGSATAMRTVVTDSDGLWSIKDNFSLGGSLTCLLTATSTSIAAGSVSRELHFSA